MIPPTYHDPAALQAVIAPTDPRAPLLKTVQGWLYRDRLPKTEIAERLPAEVGRRTPSGFWSTSLTLVQTQTAPEAVKFLLETRDGHRIESVLMLHRTGRNTLCVSSQAGCAMGCAFCATARLGLKRHLSLAEILDQVELALDWLAPQGQALRNVVFMGMGEPLLNYAAVQPALAALTDQRRYNLSPRRVTVSTCGIVPQIAALARDFPRVSLAVSLHASTDALRSRLMPVATTWGLTSLMAALDDYVRLTGNRVVYEYIMIAGVTDSAPAANQLADLLTGRPCHINLIPYNDEGDLVPDRESGDWVPRQRVWRPSDRPTLDRFQATLQARGLAVTVRHSKGEAIAAACGQLVSPPVRLDSTIQQSR